MNLNQQPEAQEQVKELARLKGRVAELEAENHRLRKGQEMIARQPSYEMLLHALPVGLILLDSKGAILQFNDSASRLLKLSKPPLHQQPLSKALEGHPLQTDLTAALTLEQQTRELQLTSGSDTGKSPVTLQLQSIRLRNRRGHLTGTALLLNDLTRSHEQAQLQSEALHMAGHELRSPLTTLIGFTELLLGQPGLGAEQQTQFLNYILEKAQLMTRIVADLQQVSRIEGEKPLLLRELLCDLRDIIRRAVEEAEWHYPRHRFLLDLPAKPLLTMIDPERIAQVLTNLFSNAAKYSPEGGCIRVRSGLGRKALRVTVSDEGNGIPADEAQRVFDRYYRAEIHRDQVRGLGLGLTISQSIVEAHGGEIWLKSSPGNGTSVCFTLPGTRDDLRHPPAGSPRPDFGLAGLAALNG